MSLNLIKDSAIDPVTEIDEFLTTAECSFVLDQLKCVQWRPSLLITRQPNGQDQPALSPGRVSETANQGLFTNDLNTFMAEIETRLMQITPLEASHLEYWQATRYPIGGVFGYHMDAGHWTERKAGNRKFTFLIYLTTPISGGSTYFRSLDRDIKAVAGRMIIWDNLLSDGSPNTKTVHRGSKLEAGEKVTLVTWLRQRPFRNENDKNKF